MASLTTSGTARVWLIMWFWAFAEESSNECKLKIKFDTSEFTDYLGGGLKYFLCSPLFGEDFQFD